MIAVMLAAVTLAEFNAAPVGARLKALGHTPMLIVPLEGDRFVAAVYAPEQGALSRWDDETRLVLYKRGDGDFERVQFVSKAGESIPGRLRQLIVRDFDGDGVDDLVAIGRPHGPVGKATIMLFTRQTVDGRFGVVFRRRQAAPAVSFGPGGALTYTFEDPQHRRRFETYRLQDHWYTPEGGAPNAVEIE